MGLMERRRFLVTSLSAAGGLAIGVSIPGFSGAAPMAGRTWDRDAAVGSSEVNAWIVIDPDDTVTIRVAKSEMGEGVLTSMPMIVAEELGCDWSKVKAEYASANRGVQEKGIYKSFSTGGSSAVRGSRPYLQQAGASARVRLVEAAARRWKVPAETCVAADSRVTHKPTGRTFSYGALAADAAKITLDKEPAIKTPDQYTLMGTPVARLDTPVKVTGQAIFGIDVQVPGMLYAAVITCPVPGGSVRSFDAKAVLNLRGVTAVVPLTYSVMDGSRGEQPEAGRVRGIAVVADRFWRAKQAIDALPIEWDYGPNATTSTAQFRKDYRDALGEVGQNAKNVGDVAGAFATGKVIESVYEVPHLAHAAMEPLNCTAHVQPGRVDIWMGTQAPDGTLQSAAKALGVPAEQIYVHNCFLGGGFGRRSVNDEMIQAVTVAKAVGKPVKLVWTREEDMRHGRYRPQAAIGFKATLGADGMPVAIAAKAAVGSILKSLGSAFPMRFGDGLEPMAAEGLSNMPYAVPNLKVDAVLKNTHMPLLFWRSVGSSQNAFAVESFIDELAFAAGQDPYRFRRKLLEGKPEYLRVLDMLAEKSNWGTAMPAGKGRGIAIHESFGTIVGEVVEVAVSAKGEVKAERVVAVVDCGHVVNPLTVAMQIESGVIYGLTAALYSAITVKNGRVEQGNFDTYDMVRMGDAPKIETHLALSGGDKWGGIGEPGTPPVAPALANAIFAATGKRVRSLPIRTLDMSGQS